MTTVLVTCALIVTGLVVHQQLFKKASPVETQFVENWRPLTENGHRFGPGDAPVEVVVFFDYQCPYCKRSMATLDTVRRRYSDRVALIFRHLPLSTHPQATPAARAAECAAEQGRFRAYHNLLFSNQDRLGNVSWDHLADSAGVGNLKIFRNCFQEQKPDRRLERDVRAARKLALRSVPTLIVNGHFLKGAPPTEVLNRLVQSALEETKS